MLFHLDGTPWWPFACAISTALWLCAIEKSVKLSLPLLLLAKIPSCSVSWPKVFQHQQRSNGWKKLASLSAFNYALWCWWDRNSFDLLWYCVMESQNGCLIFFYSFFALEFASTYSHTMVEVLSGKMGASSLPNLCCRQRWRIVTTQGLWRC